MTYDFDRVIDRRNTNSMKWAVKEQELPMWVADMDFETAPQVQRAVCARARHGVYGYAILPEEWYEAYQSWWGRRHGLELERDWLLFCSGVIPAVSSIVRKLTTPAEKVVLQTPTFNVFYNSVLNNGRQVLENPLAYEKGVYRMDFEDLEKKLSDPQTSLLILCNPQNPSGNIWDEETLARVGELCARYQVTVLSDELHCDLTAPGRSYVPFARVNETCRDISITCMGPTKAFNLAGLQTAAILIPNPLLRHKVWRAINTDEVAEGNLFAAEAAVAAYRYGEDWLDELRSYLWENKKCTEEFVADKLPLLHVVFSEATYLQWIDCSRITRDTEELAAFLRRETGLYLSEGGQYGGNGRLFLRLNIACPRSLLRDGLERLRVGVERWLQEEPYRVQRPEAPQGSTRPPLPTGRPISSETT